MPEQLALAFDSTEPPTWTYRRGMPDRSGMARYTHLAQWRHDPKETMARGGGKRPVAYAKKWSRSQPLEVAVELIRALMSDGAARTFNAICLELTGAHGDAWFEEAPDLALWQLVADGALAWACADGAVFFIASSAVDWKEAV